MGLSKLFKRPADYGTLQRMRQTMDQTLVAHGASLRTISNDFIDYKINLSLPFRLVFGSSKLQVHLTSYTSAAIQAASFSQMEVPPGSSFYNDFAFEIRPAADIRAPLLHGEILRPMPGMKGMFSLDLYRTNARDTNVEQFVRLQCPEYVRALEISAPYQKTKAQGRGKFTEYLEAYKSDYRIELQEPDVRLAQDHRSYFEACEQAFEIALKQYLTAVTQAKHENSEEIVGRNKSGFESFFQALMQKDFAVKMGRRLMKDNFNKYFSQGFWGN